MSNHSIGTFAALLLFGCLLNLSSIILTPGFSHAQMSELSDIQSGIFHLSHKNIGINAETFANDQYIDNDQAKFFAASSLPELNTPADDNYPFSLVGDYLLNSDLEIIYDYNNKSIACPAYPKKAYLSRNNYSYANFSNLPSQPDTFFNVIKGTDPYTGEKVTAVYVKVTDYEATIPEIRIKTPQSSWDFTQRDCTKQKISSSGYSTCLPKSDLTPTEACTPTKPCYSYIYDTYLRVDTASVWVWTRTRDTDLMKRCAPTTKVNSCLPPSAAHRASQPKVNTCLPPSAIRPRTIPISTCAYNELPWKILPQTSQSIGTPQTNPTSVGSCLTRT
jgi:hypothetical protein